MICFSISIKSQVHTQLQLCKICFTSCTVFHIFYPCFCFLYIQLFILTLKGLNCILRDGPHLLLYMFSVVSRTGPVGTLNHLPIFHSCIDYALCQVITDVSRLIGDKLPGMVKLGGVFLFHPFIIPISTYAAFASRCDKNAQALSQ